MHFICCFFFSVFEWVLPHLFNDEINMPNSFPSICFLNIYSSQRKEEVWLPLRTCWLSPGSTTVSLRQQRWEGRVILTQVLIISVRTDYKQKLNNSVVVEKYCLVCIEVCLYTISPSKKQLNENRERVATLDATCDWIRRGCDKFVIGPG